MNDIEAFIGRTIPVPESGCWLWEGAINSCGYGNLTIKGKQIGAHRKSYELFKGPIPKTMWVLHKCDVRMCVNPNHLFLGTAQENTIDMVRKGRHIKERPYCAGENHYCSKLIASEVIKMRTEYSKGTITIRELAKKYGVWPSTVYVIIKRKTWKHL